MSAVPHEVRLAAAGRRAMVIATNFPPDGAVGTMRTLRLVRQLAADGWSVDVVTSSPERFRPGTVSDPALLAKVPAAVHVARPRAWRPIERLGIALRPATRTQAPSNSQSPPRLTSSTTPRRRSHAIEAVRAALAVPDREVSWLVPAVLAAWRHARQNRPDIIYSSGPPFTAHLVGHAVATLLRRPWVADFRDPWARAPWREDRFAFEKRAWQALEHRVVTRADAIVFVTHTNCDDFARHYGSRISSSLHVVPNGCDVSEFDGVHPRQPGIDEPFVLLHAGSLYGARDPRPLLNALRTAIDARLVQQDRIRVRFVGRVGVPGLADAVRECGLEHVVEFVSHMPREAVLQEMVNASALLIVQPVTTVSVPAKLYEYMAAKRPVLALAEPGGETAQVVSRSGAGVVVPSHDEDAILKALVALTAAGTDRLTHVNPCEYNGEHRAKQLGRLLLDVLATGSARFGTSSRAVQPPENGNPSEATRA